LIIAIIEHSKTKSKQKIIRDPSIRKFGSARKIGYSEPERSRRLRKNRFRYKKHVRLQGSAMAAAALPAKEAKGKSMKASTWRGCYLTVATIAMWAWVDVAPTGAQSGPGGVHVQSPAKAAWNELLQRSPFPYLIPLPEPRPTAVDGTYTKSVVAHAERVHCLRCPDYAPEGGLWRIHFDKGTFRIIHTETAWKSIGT
jgi:hypothetical protein